MNANGEDGLVWRTLKEAYVQQWTTIVWYDDDDIEDKPSIYRQT